MISASERVHIHYRARQLTNQTIQRQSLSENENQDHSHKQLRLLCVCPAKHSKPSYVAALHIVIHLQLSYVDQHSRQDLRLAFMYLPDASVSHDANSHTSSQTSQPTRKTSSKMRIPIKQVVWSGFTLVDCSSKCKKLCLHLQVHSRDRAYPHELAPYPSCAIINTYFLY